MNPISYTELARLAAADASAHLSVFAPMITHGPQTAQNLIRWMNQLRRAERALREDGCSIEQTDALVGPGYLLVEDRAFWEHQRGGLAYYATPAWTTWFRVPIALPELVAVGPRFVIGPLLDVLAEGGTFWVLALDQRRARLFEASRFDIEELIPDELPTNELARHRSAATRARAGAYAAGARTRGGSAGAVFHSRGGPPERARAAELARYFRDVDATVRSRADGAKPPPLLLAGEKALLSTYRQISAYPALLDVVLPGNAAERSPESLHAAASARLDAELRAESSAAAEEYRRYEGTGLTLAEPAAVRDAALQGRVGTLLLSTATFGAQSQSGRAAVLRLGMQARSASDVLDQAAAACLAHAGTVHTVPPERMPSVGLAAALLRY